MGKRWGNALGGWKKQPRRKNGQFGSGGTSSAKKAASKKRSSSPSKKRMPKKKKAAVGAGVVVAAAGAAYAYEYSSMSREFRRSGGAVSTKDLGNGISMTTARTFKKRHVTVDSAAIHEMADGKNLYQVGKGAAKIWKPSFRPQVHSVHYLHKDDELLGYATDIVKGKKIYANDVYLKAGARGNRRTVSSLTNFAKDRNVEQVARGRKVVISKYRSEDSERVVRNQARKLGEKNVIVQKRYDPGANFTKGIKSGMDGYFFNHVKGQFESTRKKASRKAGVVI